MLYLDSEDILSMSAVSRAWYKIAHGIAPLLPGLTMKVSVSVPVDGHAVIGPYPSWPFPVEVDFSYERGVRRFTFNAIVHTMVLSDCQGINDVSALGGVHTLYLNGCRGIFDFSTLGSVRNLDLSQCPNVVDVSALGGVHTLYLCYCPNVVDVSALGGVHNLYLTGCRSCRLEVK